MRALASAAGRVALCKGTAALLRQGARVLADTLAQRQCRFPAAAVQLMLDAEPDPPCRVLEPGGWSMPSTAITTLTTVTVSTAGFQPQIVGLNVLLGLAAGGHIGHWAHLGGLLGGAAAMWLTGPRYVWRGGYVEDRPILPWFRK